MPRLHPQRMLKYGPAAPSPARAADWATEETGRAASQWRARVAGGGTTVISLFCAFPGSKEQSLGWRGCVTSHLLMATVSVQRHRTLGPQQNPGSLRRSRLHLLERKAASARGGVFPTLGAALAPQGQVGRPPGAPTAPRGNQCPLESPGPHVLSRQIFIHTELSYPRAFAPAFGCPAWARGGLVPQSVLGLSWTSLASHCASEAGPSTPDPRLLIPPPPG